MIGGTDAGAANVISGNTSNDGGDGGGIEISGIGTTGNLVEGNFIGTNPDGSAAVANRVGVSIGSGASANVIGGTAPEARNLISGNNASGIIITDAGTTLNLVEGNYIGTDNDGSGRLGNASGVSVSSGASGNVIGGTEAGAGNVISGNPLFGVVLADAGTTGNRVEGNLIGTDKDGAGVLYNITGVLIGSGASANVIGGTVPEARNVISGNKLFGVLITDTGTTANLIEGNSIGTAKDGTSPLGNTSAGVRIDADGNFVGGTASGAGNTIAFNGGAGVVVLGSGDAVHGNSIYSNAALGIDLGDDGVTPNDAGDSDDGGNRLQNFPVLTSASSSPTATTVVGTLDSVQFTVFTIEFFGSSAADPSGFGQGQQVVGSTTVTTDGAGHASFTATFPTAIAAGAMVTATATDPGNNTSEFSRAIVQSLGITIDDVTQDEGNGLVTGFTFTVSLSQATNQPVSVDFATLDGLATAGSDYTAAMGTLTFAAGDTSQTITVLVTGDTTSEADESFFVALSNASQGFIADNLGVGIIANDDGALSISDVSKAEGNTGLTPFTFTVSLANATTKTVTVNYATADGSATVAGGDYVAASGTLTFNPGDVSKTVTVSVKGDTVYEPDETFLVNLSGASNAAIVDDQGLGTILNDDDGPALPLISINSVTVIEGNSGTVNATFTVSLSAASSSGGDGRFSHRRRHGHGAWRLHRHPGGHADLQPRRARPRADHGRRPGRHARRER